MFLIGDVGGTNSRFTLFSHSGDKFTLEDERRKQTNSFDSFEHLLSHIQEKDSRYDVNKCRNCVFAVPGPVTSENLLSFPNIKWKINRARLKKLYPDTEISFVNDFTAQAYGCLTEATANALPIISTEQTQDDIAIVGAGTGLGHGTLKKISTSAYVHIPSESGQIPFPFTADDFEQRYRAFIVQQTGIANPVGDDVVSGRGLTMLHQFLTGNRMEPSEVAAEIDPASETTHWFAKFYARDCRNYVLTTLAAGGRLFISGGVAMKNPFLVDNDAFRKEFMQGSSTAKDVLAHISVALLQDERIGLFGAAYYAAHIAAAD
ncbi:Glucokinase [Candidatus Electronema halotolerans]